MTPLSQEDLRLLVAVAVLNVPVYVLMWVAFFGSWSDFTNMVHFWFTPRWLDWLRGDAEEDAWQHAKLMMFAVMAGLMVISESVSIHRNLPILATTLSGWIKFF